MMTEILISGVVQGVGFRPFVKKLADSFGFKGSVKNTGGVVSISLSDISDSESLAFMSALRDQAPAGSLILDISVHKKNDDPEPAALTGGFAIVSSADREIDELSVFSPDIAVCDTCLDQMRSVTDRRYGYPMISCTLCGPRFSILKALPYDRERTSMSDFTMCSNCLDEYRDVKNMRCHAQTISCNSCGPKLVYINEDEGHKDGEDAINKAALAIKRGRVVGLKAVGGFQLLADPKNSDAVNALRTIKGRDSKPFAVMFGSVSEIKRFCEVSPEEERLLLSSARPIVLLNPLKDGVYREWDEGVLSDSAYIGAFLPSFGAQQLLLEQTGPFIATSANIQNEIMDISLDDFLCHFGQRGKIAGVLTHDREIMAPLDDSVVFDGGDGPVYIRRARGYVPLPVIVSGRSSGDIIAFGGDLKAAFAVARGERIILSQPFGDMVGVSNRDAYLKEIERFIRIFGIKPGIVVCDAHPGYETARLSREFSAQNGLGDVKQVYHHHAHALSVMAERRLVSALALILDGTGFGPDGTIWGGELLMVRGAEFERLWHLPRMQIPGGDAAARDAELSAAGYLYSRGEDIRKLSLDKEKERMILKALWSGTGVVTTTSAGRLFDAKARILNICAENSYEGECAARLESRAAGWIRDGADPDDEKGFKAYTFHRELAQELVGAAVHASEKTGERRVVLSGGSFVNRLLLSFVEDGLEAQGLEAVVPSMSPCGDGGLAVGQAYYAMLESKGRR